MPSSNEDGAAAAAEQLGSVSLGVSAERKDNETENNEDSDKSGTPTKLCSACDKESDALMKCRACKCVWYCDKKCQNKHWKEHKIECKRIKSILDQRGGKSDVGTEKEVGPLGKVPPQEECPICMHALPLHGSLHRYSSCCGKTICCGCSFQHQMKSTERVTTCAFCRTALPDSDEEILARRRKRVELKDPQALRAMAMHYGKGELGLRMDQTKCIELMRQSADLGCPAAQYNLGCYYHFGEMGLEQNVEEALKYFTEAAEDGDLVARHNLGCVEEESGDHVAAMRHWRQSASGGFKKSMENLIVFFEHGDLRHGDLAEILQVFYRARAEMKSEDRDKFIKHLKETGEYNEEFDL